MELTAIENRKTELEIFHNFRVTKNIPLDSRIIINSLSTIETELPLQQRYDGMIFFVEDAVINGITGSHYYFGKNLSNPIPLLQAIVSGDIQQIITGEINYSNLNTLLNATNSSAGNIVTIKPLDITVIFDGSVWKYFSGKYKISVESVYLNIPTNLKEIGKIVQIGINIFTEKIIENDLTLSSNICDRFDVFPVTLMKGKTRINHQFASSYISSFLRIYGIENINEQNNQISLTKFEIVDDMNIDVLCSFDNISADVYIISHKIQ